MIYQIVHIFFYLIFIYLSLVVGYMLILAIAGNFSRRIVQTQPTGYKRIAVLIATYREDDVIVNTVTSATAHDYPKPSFDVFVAADHLQNSTIEKLKATGAIVYKLEFEHSSKARSLNFLLNKIDESRYDLALVLDGDNIMDTGLLQQINKEAYNGNLVVQAHRTAKNMNTPVAVLDALSEEVNNHLFRNGPAQLGLSSSLIGSGMAFPFGVLKKIYNKPGIIDNPACDREVDFEVLVNDLKVHYLAQAKVLDEKVATQLIYKNQRRRWLESQWMHIGLFFSDWTRVPKKKADFWHKLFVTLLPPRLILLALFFFIVVLACVQIIWGVEITGINTSWWLGLFGAYLVTILLSIPRRFYSRQTLKAIFYLPAILFTFLRALITVRSKRTEFVHTPKTFTNSSATTTDGE